MSKVPTAILPQWDALTVTDTPLSAPCIFDELHDDTSSGSYMDTCSSDDLCEKKGRETELQNAERKDVQQNIGQEQSSEKKDAGEKEATKKIPTVKERLQMLRRSAGEQWVEPEVAEPEGVIEDLAHENPNESDSRRSETTYLTAEKLEQNLCTSTSRPSAICDDSEANSASEMDARPILTCFACKHDYPRREFTQNQLQKGRKRRCPECVRVDVQAPCITA